MKFSEQWLRQWVSINANTQELANKLTMAGLEVDSISPAAGIFSGVVVGEVIQCQPHPNADKLQVTQVSIGSEQFQVVCGASNVEVGLKFPFAMIGAVLPNNFKIKKALLRGVESFGMLCSEKELELSDANNGLFTLPNDAPVGEDIRSYLKLDDQIIDIDLTPNRSDCLSILGLARETGANFLSSVKTPLLTNIKTSLKDTLSIDVVEPEACPRIITRMIKNINIKKSTPLWMVEYLRRSGVRSIDSIVDVTAYVMLELGQPMHGYDLNQLQGGLKVRFASQNEPLTLLNGDNIKLTQDTLIIADQSKALGIAGIMGGKKSGTTKTTTNILLEAAFFNPITISGKARLYGLHTDASHRFERGVDPQLQHTAIERATQLILDICGGEASAITEVCNPQFLPKNTMITLHTQRIQSVLGISLDESFILDALSRLGCSIEPIDHQSWQVKPPSWRFDLNIEEDLIEELGRLYGYNNLPTTQPSQTMSMRKIPESITKVSDLRRLLVGFGYQEVICFSFIDPSLQKQCFPNETPLTLTNPISADLSVMRTSLIPGLINTIQTNLNRQHSRVRLFEIGQTFKDPNHQTEMLAIALTGSKLLESWNSNNESINFYDLKGDIEKLFKKTGIFNQIQFIKGNHESMHPGQCAAIIKNNHIIGHIGTLHPQLRKKLNLNQNIVLFEASLHDLTNGSIPQIADLSKFPEVRRDLSLLVHNDIPANKLLQIVRQKAGSLLSDVYLFDVYTGAGIEKNHKSLALAIKLQHITQTLTDDMIQKTINDIINELKQECNATIRV